MSVTAHFAEIILLLLILGLATYCDLRYHRIPNALSIGGAVAGFILYLHGFGGQGALLALGGIGVGLGLFLPLYALGGMGAGDVKLMAAVGAFLGPAQTALAVGLSLIAGGVLALVVLLVRGGLMRALARYGSTFRTLIYTGRPGLSYVPPAAGEAAASRFPYALAIALGSVAAVWGSAIRQTLF